MGRTNLPVLILGITLLALATGPTISATAGTAPLVGPADLDAQPVQLDSDTLFWTGQTVHFNGSVVITDVETADIDDRTFELREVADGDRAGPLVREFIVDRDGESVLDLGGLEGRYVITYQGEVVYVQDGTGYTSGPPDGTAVTVENSAWQVVRQSLDAEWSDDQVFRTETAELRIDSNRAVFLLEVAADGLSFDDLESMFDADDFAPDHDAKADDDVLVLESTGETAFPVTFRELDYGVYTLEIQVTDTDARTTADIRVGRPPATTETLSETPTATLTPTPSPTSTASIASPTTTQPTTVSPAATTVEPTATSPPGTPTASPGQPGFGIGLALLAVGIAVLAHRRLRP